MIRPVGLSIFCGIIERILGFCSLRLSLHGGSISGTRFSSRIFLEGSFQEFVDQQSSYRTP
jgi:hypothetical protein